VKLWEPSAAWVEASNMTALIRAVNARFSARISDYDGLWRFSVERRAEFWDAAWDFFGVLGTRNGDRVLIDDAMPGARFFPDARMSFPQNLLRREDDGDAIVFNNERGETRKLSWRELRNETSRLIQALRELGVGSGDVVAGYLPNIPEAVIAMLATTSLGAIWTSCSPDFGSSAVLDRFGQTKPKLLFCADGHLYGGKAHPSAKRAGEIAAALPSVEQVVLIDYLGSGEMPPKTLAWEALLEPHSPDALFFEQLPFDHPLYVMYSSGTTGPPKAMVHGAGGSLLQHLKEHRLHFDIRPGDRVFYYSTLGWMMWNWLVSVLASEATILLYDGSPVHPSPSALFDYASRERMTHFGVSAKLIDAVMKSSVPLDMDLSSLRLLASTGSPLSPECFDWVYRAVKRDVLLASVSGGTDILSAFVGSNPNGAVYRGEIQGPALGMAVDVFDENGASLRGTKGELVCTKSFPSMPLEFWNDPDGARYRAAYFEHYPGVWRHGDFAEITEHGGYIIHGRSDATLNPGGVRIGTAEIYNVVEALEGVAEAIAIAQAWNDDTRIVLFVRLEHGHALDESMCQRIRTALKGGCSPRHVPAKILAVDDIPRTKTGKIVELAVTDVVHGRGVSNREALANPEALDGFRNRAELLQP
jgi:acetoacetyl-CoA synthetase